MLKKFNVTFTEKKKYNPNTRTILAEVHASEKESKDVTEKKVETFVYGQFGSEKKITIGKIEEVKEEKEKK
jgi:ribosomal protein L20A (L18A)